MIFLGASEDAEYQSDIDRNVMELAKFRPSEGLRLSLIREFADRQVIFFPNPQSSELHPLQNLLFAKVPKVEVAGKLQSLDQKEGAASIVATPSKMKAFLQEAFRLPKSRRMLVVYAHGLGYEGLQGISLAALRELLLDTLPKRSELPLDILWLDSCFMASIEVAMELKGVTRQLIGSQEAEFSSGAPFDVLPDLLEKQPDEIETVSLSFAERFLESYSFAEKGSQTSSVAKSSATISVIEPERLPRFIPSIGAISRQLAELPGDWRSKLQKSIAKLQMEKSDLIDLGSFALLLKHSSLLPSKDGSPLNRLLSDLEIQNEGKLRTNPRVLVRAPKEGSLLVFGYDQWKRGDEADSEVLDKLPSNLTPAGFSKPNEQQKRWPYRPVNRRLFLTPFTVGLQEFNFFFADPKTGNPLTSKMGVNRVTDYVTFSASHPSNPIRFSGYTQGIGKLAERYSGLNVVNPLQGTPSVDYLDLEFYRTTQWSSF